MDEVGNAALRGTSRHSYFYSKRQWNIVVGMAFGRRLRRRAYYNDVEETRRAHLR